VEAGADAAIAEKDDLMDIQILLESWETSRAGLKIRIFS